MTKGAEAKTPVSTPESRVYLAGDIMRILCIGKTKVYDFLEKVYEDKEPFIVLKVGKCVRVPKESFDRWFCQMDMQEEVK